MVLGAKMGLASTSQDAVKEEISSAKAARLPRSFGTGKEPVAAHLDTDKILVWASSDLSWKNYLESSV